MSGIVERLTIIFVNSFQNHKNSRHFRVAIIKKFMISPNPEIMRAVPEACLRIRGEKDAGKNVPKGQDVPQGLMAVFGLGQDKAGQKGPQGQGKAGCGGGSTAGGASRGASRPVPQPPDPGTGRKPWRGS